MARTFTLLQLRTWARQRADMVTSQFVTDAELTDYVNASYCELYELLVKSGLAYYESSTTITVNGTTSTYDLPADFMGAIKVSWKLDAQRWINIPELMPKEVDIFPNNAFRALGYRITGKPGFNNDQIIFYPIPTAGQVYRVIYVPAPNAFYNDDDLFDGVSGWEELIVVDCAIKMLIKEESDTAALERQKQALLDRIKESAELRAVTENRHIVDTRSEVGGYRDAADWWPRQGWRW